MEFMLFNNTIERNTDHLIVDSAQSTQDLFALIPQEIYRVIFDFCAPKDQLSLSRTCRRNHSMKWLESVWKEESMELFEQVVPFSTQFFEVAIEQIGIPWIKVLGCLSKPNETKSSFRRYDR
eukprot:TRINITY_DN5408_c0_g1_i1.p1 TRINITY_DN5408_c0_g1~~TRINITY_DN5408_c0_g1_i1.p1  ORF type:complete len:122 (-),score=17.32 TRINITY_DN5408_c0_g1_i1:223-588(-)